MIQVFFFYSRGHRCSDGAAPGERPRQVVRGESLSSPSSRNDLTSWFSHQSTLHVPEPAQMQAVTGDRNKRHAAGQGRRETRTTNPGGVTVCVRASPLSWASGSGRGRAWAGEGPGGDARTGWNLRADQLGGCTDLVYSPEPSSGRGPCLKRSGAVSTVGDEATRSGLLHAPAQGTATGSALHPRALFTGRSSDPQRVWRRGP